MGRDFQRFALSWLGFEASCKYVVLVNRYFGKNIFVLKFSFVTCKIVVSLADLIKLHVWY